MAGRRQKRKGDFAMNSTQDDRLKQMIKAELESIGLSEEENSKCLYKIHNQIQERRKGMKFSKKKMVVLLTAALTVAVMGTVTAVAAGKITGLISSSSKDSVVDSAAKLADKAKETIGTAPKIPEAFANGLQFQSGEISIVDGVDENMNPVSSYPEMNARYGHNGKVVLSAYLHSDLLPEETKASQKQEIYKNITLEANEDQYLFLPPDAEPSAEDLKLEEEGKLYISYGSQEEERQIFRSVKWVENDMVYLLFNFDDMELDQLIAMAKEVIDK